METPFTENLPSTKGKKGRVRMPDGEVLTFKVEDDPVDAA
jgi:hypothetical protein